MRQEYETVPATKTAIRRMIEAIDGDSFEERRSIDQFLTFDALKGEFADLNMTFDQQKMKGLNLISGDGLYTNLGFLLSDQNPCTIRAQSLMGRVQLCLRPVRIFPALS